MILGVDPGTKRVGLAVADEETRLATPLDVVAADEAVDAIAKVVADKEVTRVVVGRPVTLRGTTGPAIEDHRGFIEDLRRALAVPVVEHDERFSSVVAEQGLRAAGTKGRNRTRLVDAVAAQVMLQSYLDSER